MSLEQPREVEATPVDAIAAIGRGEFTPRDLIPLSDLGRADAAKFGQAWDTWPEAIRERVVRDVADMAESNVQYTFGRVLRVALRDPSAVVRQLAVAALWEDEGSDLPSILLDVVGSDPSQDVRAEAALGLERFAELAASDDLEDSLAHRIRQSLTAVASDPQEPYVVRRRALGSVAVMDRGSDIVHLIRDAYNADDAGLRAGAIYAMGRSLDPGWLDAILHEFSSPDAEMRYEAARACGELGDDHAIPGLIRLAREEDVEVRQAAIGSLGRIGGAAAVNALRRLAQTARSSDAEAIDDALEEALVSIDALRTRT